MKIKKYVGDLLGGNLFITESRIIAESLLKNLPYEEWKLLIVEENILQKKATRTSVRYAQAIRLRFSSLGLDFMADLLAADERAYTQMLMMALLINSPIVADFMKFSLAEARRTKKTNLNSDVWAKFYIAQSKVYDDLNKYSHKTIEKMGTNAVGSLVLSGYLSDTKTKKIQPVQLTPEVTRWLKRLDREDLISVMEYAK